MLKLVKKHGYMIYISIKRALTVIMNKKEVFFSKKVRKRKILKWKNKMKKKKKHWYPLLLVCHIF